MLNNEMKKAMDQFKSDLEKEAMNVLHVVFPEKMVKLNGQLDEIIHGKGDFALSKIGVGCDARIRPAHEFHVSSRYAKAGENHKDSSEEKVMGEASSGSNSKKRRISKTSLNDSNGTISGLVEPNESSLTSHSQGPRYDQFVMTNDHVVKLIKMLKIEYVNLVDNCDRLRLWVNLKMPRMEDGDNFGVQIQEETLAELSRAQETGYTFMESVTKYYFSRAKLSSKLIKYPHVEDYHAALFELDSKFFFNMRQYVADLRNLYAVLYDMITKNLQKIQSPKGNNSSNMY